MITWILTTVAGFILRTSSNRILRDIAGTIAAGDDNQARIAIAQIEAEVETRKAVKEVRLATAGFLEMRVMTVLITLPPVIHLWAVTLDTVFQFGWKIPKLPYPFDENSWAILLSYFGITAGTRIATSIISAIRR
jgi:hypothetical protein